MRRETESGRDGETAETVSGRSLAGLMIVSLLAATSCSHRKTESLKPEAPRSIDEVMARLNQCAPKNADEGTVSLAIQSVTHEAQATKVTIVAAAAGKPVDFHLPFYRMSSGRWLINGTGRAYLLDEECREYKLKDRKSLPGFEIPLKGQIQLKAGQRFEAVLVFPRVSERSRVGMLVYDGRPLPLVFGPESR